MTGETWQQGEGRAGQMHYCTVTHAVTLCNRRSHLVVVRHAVCGCAWEQARQQHGPSHIHHTQHAWLDASPPLEPRQQHVPQSGYLDVEQHKADAQHTTDEAHYCCWQHCQDVRTDLQTCLKRNVLQEKGCMHATHMRRQPYPAPTACCWSLGHSLTAAETFCDCASRVTTWVHNTDNCLSHTLPNRCQKQMDRVQSKHPCVHRS
jgi:hypothetical protein